MSFIASVLVIIFIILICSVCTGKSSNKNNNMGGYTESTGNINVIDTNFRESKVECPHCLRMVPASSKFCPGCGYQLTRVVRCPNCGSAVNQGYGYCANCGTRISR